MSHPVVLGWLMCIVVPYWSPASQAETTALCTPCMIKEYVAASFHIEREDFYQSPFNTNGRLGKMWQLFETEAEEILKELNQILAP